LTSEEARAVFPVLERVAYLNAGTNGPLARATHEAMVGELRRALDEGRGGPPYYERFGELRAAARERLAGLIGVPAAQVALTTSTTTGCNIVLGGLELGPDDEVVTTDAEHFGLIGPLGASGARVRVARVTDRPAAEAFGTIAAEVTPRTRLLALSHVAWTTGNVLPIRELREETGLPVLVDGAQSGGAIEVDASPYDFYTVSGQKWPCGPDGTGALYVADPERLRIAAPSHFSQSSYEPDGSYTPRDGAERFDSTGLTLPALAGLVAAIDGAPPWRFQRAAEVAARCRQRLGENFTVVTAPGQATLVTFEAPGDPAEAARRAFERGVTIRYLPRTAWLRVSCGYWTNEDDIERLVGAVQATNFC
jgi:L-cysteine/cystine lyase